MDSITSRILTVSGTLRTVVRFTTYQYDAPNPLQEFVGSRFELPLKISRIYVNIATPSLGIAKLICTFDAFPYLLQYEAHSKTSNGSLCCDEARYKRNQVGDILGVSPAGSSHNRSCIAMKHGYKTFLGLLGASYSRHDG